MTRINPLARALITCFRHSTSRASVPHLTRYHRPQFQTVIISSLSVWQFSVSLVVCFTFGRIFAVGPNISSILAYSLHSEYWGSTPEDESLFRIAVVADPEGSLCSNDPPPPDCRALHSEMTYIVSGGALNSTHSLTWMF